jgi:hypothetical protein
LTALLEKSKLFNNRLFNNSILNRNGPCNQSNCEHLGINVKKRTLVFEKRTGGLTEVFTAMQKGRQREQLAVGQVSAETYSPSTVSELFPGDLLVMDSPSFSPIHI